jgi:hypothetical protein
MGCCTSAEAQEVIRLPMPDLFSLHANILEQPNIFLAERELQKARAGGEEGRWPQWKARMMRQYSYDPDFFPQHCHRICFHDTAIEKDLNRTLPHCEYYREVENILKLSRVLRAVAHYFPKVGYTQGMNFVCGMILLVSRSDTEAFWFFVQMALHPDYLSIGFYCDGFKLY